jgi:hypothetical protein
MTWFRRLYFAYEGYSATVFIALKIYCPRPGSNPRTLDPKASTIATRELDHRERRKEALKRYQAYELNRDLLVWKHINKKSYHAPAGAKDFPSILSVQTGSGAHPASYTMGTGGPFPGGKARPGRDADHSPPSSAEVVNE